MGFFCGSCSSGTTTSGGGFSETGGAAGSVTVDSEQPTIPTSPVPSATSSHSRRRIGTILSSIRQCVCFLDDGINLRDEFWQVFDDRLPHNFQVHRDIIVNE